MSHWSLWTIGGLNDTQRLHAASSLCLLVSYSPLDRHIDRKARAREFGVDATQGRLSIRPQRDDKGWNRIGDSVSKSGPEGTIHHARDSRRINAPPGGVQQRACRRAGRRGARSPIAAWAWAPLVLFPPLEADRALQAEAKFTVPLLDRMKVLRLNIWREIIRREHGLHLVG